MLLFAERQLSDKQKELELRNAKISELTDLIADKERKMQEIKEKLKSIDKLRRRRSSNYY